MCKPNLNYIKLLLYLDKPYLSTIKYQTYYTFGTDFIQTLNPKDF